MNALEYILNKQIEWAHNHGIELIGSKIDRGRPLYTTKLEENLFEPLSSSTQDDFDSGDGRELTGYPAKMQALHSSSALGVNIFQYWDMGHEISNIAHLCGFCNRTTQISQKISFEMKYPIDDRFRMGPNIDVVITNDPKAKYKVYAIECKFSEAYGGWEHTGLKEKYLGLDIWADIPNLYEYAKSISPKEEKNRYLHAAQLIKHILGLQRKYGKKGFRLLYLWYDVIGSEGAKHQEETDDFLSVSKADGIKVHAQSYQELISRIAIEHREDHNEYVKYITDRYL